MKILLLIIAIYLVVGVYLAKKNQSKRLVFCIGMFFLVSNIPIIESLNIDMYTLAYNFILLPICALFNLYVITCIDKDKVKK